MTHQPPVDAQKALAYIKKQTEYLSSIPPDYFSVVEAALQTAAASEVGEDKTEEIYEQAWSVMQNPENKHRLDPNRLMTRPAVDWHELCGRINRQRRELERLNALTRPRTEKPAEVNAQLLEALKEMVQWADPYNSATLQNLKDAEKAIAAAEQPKPEKTGDA
jgi:hypothetical protein